MLRDNAAAKRYARDEIRFPALISSHWQTHAEAASPDRSGIPRTPGKRLNSLRKVLNGARLRLLTGLNWFAISAQISRKSKS